jgi:general secretion pathway protein G
MVVRSRESKVFFPWERRRGVFGLLGRARVRLVAAVIVGLVLIVAIRGREERAAGVRATRASLLTAHRAVSAFRADHAGGCPKEWTELVTRGYASEVPSDAWGRPLRLTCPGRRDPAGYDLASDGPDGLPGGLDRIE